MVHHIPERAPASRKRDRRAAGLPPPALMHGPAPPKMTRLDMHDTYQPWVLHTYGDSAKTKTITRNKYQRILQILRGDFVDNESSKFKLWVKGRGFRIGPPPGYISTLDGITTHSLDYNPDKDPSPDIYVQTGTLKDPEGHDRICYKKVAVVEDFFDIIYNLHVCKDGKDRKHMGQKRTYRAVSERYAFVPREAVTKFLVLCTECPRRSVTLPLPSPLPSPLPTPLPTSLATGLPIPVSGLANVGGVAGVPVSVGTVTGVPVSLGLSLALTPSPISLSVDVSPPPPPPPPHTHTQAVRTSTPTLSAPPSQEPPTTLAHHPHPPAPPRPSSRTQAPTLLPHPPHPHTPSLHPKPTLHHQQPPPPQAPPSPPRSPTPPPAPPPRPPTAYIEEVPPCLRQEPFDDRLTEYCHEVGHLMPITTLYRKHISGALNNNNNNKNNYNAYKEGAMMAESEGSDDDLKNEVERKTTEARGPEWCGYPNPMALHKTPPESCRRSPSPPGSERGASGTPLDTTMPLDTASNPEDTSSNGNKDDEDDDGDDNDDDDKIDAHYDPERLKAFNMFVRLFVDENLDRIVPISKQPKEKIQAIIDACARQFPEFADRTRKRIRTYLKSCRRNKRTRDTNGWETPSRPTPPHLTSIQAEQILATACENEAQNAKRMRLGLEPISQPNPLNPQPTPTHAQVLTDKPLPLVESKPDAAPHMSALAKALERPLAENKALNGSSMFQSTFQQSFQKMSSLTGSTVHTQNTMSPLLSVAASGAVANGPTDLSVKGTSAKPPRPSLNAVEVAAVRQLITGYRESAAFLLRSADELENLLMHQQAP
ncbi:nucleolar protein 4-like isoform X2 [Oratosquilla oratoria]|uniref:nucleolar protein 4-like isoform X2 n=1 Tax=Oratosquilla oratoria TaxID=337810 RepID=UPI003F7700A8